MKTLQLNIDSTLDIELLEEFQKVLKKAQVKVAKQLAKGAGTDDYSFSHIPDLVHEYEVYGELYEQLSIYMENVED